MEQRSQWVPQDLSTAELLPLCAGDTGNALIWSEFLRRFTPKIKIFIRRTLRQSYLGSHGQTEVSSLLGGLQEGDLFQNTILRLVENDCAVLKRFSGENEEQFLAYLAVVTRSVVRDCLRRQRAEKRPPPAGPHLGDTGREGEVFRGAEKPEEPPVYRKILAREIRELGLRAIRNLSGSDSQRDRLIFDLFFYHDLTPEQIACCRAIGLSRAGVQKVLRRLEERVKSQAATISQPVVTS